MLGQEESWLGIVRRASHRERVRQVLGLLEHAEIPMDLQAGRLTQAGRQVVEIARALIRESRILIFDEPTSSLNDHDATRLFGVIAGLRKRGIGIVYISHFLHELGRVAERFTVLRDGRSVATGRLAEVDPKGLASLMVGRELSELFPRVEHEVGDPLLTVTELRGVRLPVSASLTLNRGEILGIAGLVGSGRTEFLRAIYGLDAIRSGVVRAVAFGEFSRMTPATSIKAGLGFLSEDRKGEGLALGRSIEDNLTDSALAKYGFAGWLNLTKRRRAARAWMDRLRIKANRPTALVGSLSGGNQQKVAIGRLLHQEADLLLLDEPTRGVDIGSKIEIYRMIGELAARGKSVLMVSSQLPELLGVCDRIAVMSRGMLSQPRPVHEWTESKMMEAATAETPAQDGSR